MTVLEICSTILRNNYVRVDQVRRKHNLIDLVRTMPKLQTHAAALKKQRLKIKEKSAKYVPGTVNLQVLGSGAYGAPRSLYMFTDQSRYLFNCGEGSQRLAHEHKMKLAKLEHIFFTHGSWNNIGGLPGMSLTIQDVGIPEITLHGPKGIEDIFRAAKRFIVLNNLKISTSNYNEVDYFEDNVMRVRYVPLDISETHRSRRSEAVSLDRASSKQRQEASSSGCSSGTDGETTDDDIDYYAYEREPRPSAAEENGVKNNTKKKKKKKRSSSVDCELDAKRRRVDASASVGSVSVAYICRLHDRPGALLLERCVERGVPPGPLLGRLKAGQDITLDNGTVVKSEDVTSPNESGAVFIVVECPDERFLDPLEKEKLFAAHQTGASCPEDVAFLVVHFTPPSIIKHPRYQRWMQQFHSITNHLIINETNLCKGSIAVHRIQTKLNLLDKRVFPILPLEGVVIASPPHSNGSLQDTQSSSSSEYVSAVSSVTSSSSSSSSSSSATTESSDEGQEEGAIVQSKTFTSVHLRPNKQVDTGDKLVFDKAEYLKEALDEPGIEQVLLELDRRRGMLDSTTTHRDYPNIVFLGTGSCIPNKARNTSGILINISPDHCMLFDCGEGTFGQLVRFHGVAQMPHLLRSLKAVFVSHLHADHHIGLIGLLKAWRNAHAQDDTSTHAHKLFLVAPRQIMSWLDHYDTHFERVMDGVELVPNSDLLYNDFTLSAAVNNRLLSSLGLSSVKSALVKHCPNAFGIAIEHEAGWKITYSGDTMFSTSLVELGKNSSVLIHEATMGDDLIQEARRKMHSTTSEAIDAGKQMNAKFTILTHFSQRYATLPLIDDKFTDNVCIAFDNMSVRLTDLPKLPLFYPALKLIFSEHMEEMNLRVFRREMKELRAKDKLERERLSS